MLSLRIALAVSVAIALAVPVAASLAPAHPVAPLPPNVIPNELIVSVGPGGDLAAAEGSIADAGGVVLMRDEVLGWASARFASAAAAARAERALEARDGVLSVEHDGIVTVAGVPNDPMYGQQWGYTATMAPLAWDVTVGSHAVKVAVLDTGLQTNHPDLAANMCGPYASFNPSEPTINDLNGHGTHVAGTIAAVSNNGVGVAGMSQSCLMGAKVLSASGGGQWTWVAAGMRWAADNGADVVSMSLGGFSAPDIVRQASDYVYVTKGVLLVAAAGNAGCPANGATTDGTIIDPARYDSAMAVASTDNPGLLTSGFSSCGKDIEIAAPGGGVLSTWTGSSYATISGTSMATPHVSGVAALVLDEHPTMSAVALRCVLDVSAEDGLPPGRDFKHGWGRLNALKALELARVLADAGTLDDFEAACASNAATIFH